MRKKRYSKHVGVLFTDETYDLLVKITDKKEVSLSEFIRTTIEQILWKIEEEGRIE
jgi:hypothetical protein